MKANHLDNLLNPISRCFTQTPDVAEQLLEVKIDRPTQERLDRLADKSTEGELTSDERAEYESYVHAIDFITILQAEACKSLDSPQRRGRLIV